MIPMDECTMLQRDTSVTVRREAGSKRRRIVRRTSRGRTDMRHSRNSSADISASDEAMAAPAMPMSRPNMSSVLPAMFTAKAIMAAAVSGRVTVMPTRKARMARNGNEKAIPQRRQSRYVVTAPYMASDLTMALSSGGETSFERAMHAAAIAASSIAPCTNAFAAASRLPAPLFRAMTDCIPRLKPNPIMYTARNQIPPKADAPSSVCPTCPRNRASVMFISCSTRMLIMTGRLMSHIFLYVYFMVFD